MTPTLEQTEALVREKFADHEDRGGAPMAEHMARVVARLEGEDELTLHAAWLHDIVEDTDVTIEALHDMGYPVLVVDAVATLTRDAKNETYADYINRICNSGDLRAIKVKLADQEDNLDPERWLKMNRYVRRALGKRYAGVKQRLLTAAVGLS